LRGEKKRESEGHRRGGRVFPGSIPADSHQLGKEVEEILKTNIRKQGEYILYFESRGKRTKLRGLKVEVSRREGDTIAGKLTVTWRHYNLKRGESKSSSEGRLQWGNFCAGGSTKRMKKMKDGIKLL